MTAVLVTNIGELVTNDPERGVLENAALVADADRVVWLGPASAAPAADHRIDVGGRARRPRLRRLALASRLRRRPLGGVRGARGGRTL